MTAHGRRGDIVRPGGVGLSPHDAAEARAMEAFLHRMPPPLRRDGLDGDAVAEGFSALHPALQLWALGDWPGGVELPWRDIHGWEGDDG